MTRRKRGPSTSRSSRSRPNRSNRSVASGRGTRPGSIAFPAKGRKLVRAVTSDYAAGRGDGLAWRSSAVSPFGPDDVRKAVHERWGKRYGNGGGRRASDWQSVVRRGGQYAAGFMQGCGMQAYAVPVPLTSTAAAVVCAGKDEDALRTVLGQLRALPFQEIVVIAGNSSERLYAIARECGNAMVVCLPEAVDSDVGRALGAKLTGADTVLFADGERAASADRLGRFLWECDGGKKDVVLNDIASKMGLFKHRGGTERLFEFLNASLNRPDLKINSLAALPFAMSRQALDTLGAAALTVPVKAHAQAVLKGLRIGTGGFAGRSGTGLSSDAEWRKTAGDHAEAWVEAFGIRGNRLKFADATRNRSLLGEWER